MESSTEGTADPVAMPPDSVELHAKLRPSVMHLFMLTTFAAMFLTLNRALYDDQGSGAFRANNTIHAILNACILTGAVLVIWEWKRQNRLVVRQAGHWLLVISSFSTLMSYPVFAWFLRGFELYSPAGGPVLLPWVAIGSLYAVVAACHGFAATRCTPYRWKIALVCFAVAGVTTCANFCLIAFSNYGVSLVQIVLTTVAQWGTAVVALTVTVAATIDYFKTTKRDWLHWLGVATYLVTAAIELVTQLLYVEF